MKSISGDDRDVRPVPDPTFLTTQQLEREIASLRTLIDMQIAPISLDIARLNDEQLRLPDLIALAIRHLREVVDEKFHSIDKQFVERDTRTEQTQRDSKVAVDAALQAAKEAVGEQNKSSSLAINKSEASTNKQIEAIQALIGSVEGTFSGKIEDLKERIALMEGHNSGSTSVWLYIIALGGVILAAISVIYRLH